MIRQLNRDPWFWAAILAAPVFWGLLFLYRDITFDVFWPLRSSKSLLLSVLLYPILEELVFRGWVQSGLWEYAVGRRRLGPISLANLLTSGVFAGFHLFRQSPGWALAIMVPSLVFGFFRDKYQRLTPAIILHIFYNTGFFWLFTSS